MSLTAKKQGPLKRDYGIIIFGFMEIGIGLVTLVAVSVSLVMHESSKPLGVLIFVLATSVISFALGIGILRYKLAAYRILLYFATVIILSKMLIFAQVITLSGALEITIPPNVKNLASIIYHGLLIWYFLQPQVRRQFS